MSVLSRVLVTLLALALCACGSGISNTGSRELTLDDALAQVESVALPGLDADTAAQLRAAFSDALIATGKTRFTSAVPTVGPTDLSVTDNMDGSVTFFWHYRNPGDLDQNSEVNISDLSALGANLGKKSTDADWAKAQPADGDNNGEVNISDITSIGANLLNRIDAYRLEESVDDGDNWTLCEEIPFADSSLPPGGGKRFFSHDFHSATDGALYRVVGVSDAQLGGASNEVLYVSGAPGQVENLTATQGTLAEAIELNWDSYTGSFEYEVERGDSASGPFTFFVTVTGGATTWPHAAPADVHYWYRVIARDIAGPISGPSDPAEGWAAAAPAQISNVAATQGTVLGAVELSWDAHPDAGFGYGVHRGDSETGPWTLLGSPITNSYTDSTAAPGVHYWYQVEGYTLEGPFGMSVAVEGWAAEQIVNLVATQGTVANAVDLTWDSHPFATGYSVYRGDAETGPWTHLQDVFTNAYTDTTAVPGVHYWYQVAGFELSGPFGMSEPAEGWAMDPPGPPPTLVLDSPPPTGDGTAGNPYEVPADSDWLFTLSDLTDGDVTGSGTYTTSDPGITISGGTLLVGSSPPASFDFYGTYNGQDSNRIYFTLSVPPGGGPVIFPWVIDPNWLTIPNYFEPEAGTVNNPFTMHSSSFNPDMNGDQICDTPFTLQAEDQVGDPIDNEDLEWGCFPPDMAADINTVGDKGKFHVTTELQEGYVFATDAGSNESNWIHIEVIP